MATADARYGEPTRGTENQKAPRTTTKSRCTIVTVFLGTIGGHQEERTRGVVITERFVMVREHDHVRDLSVPRHDASGRRNAGDLEVREHAFGSHAAAAEQRKGTRPLVFDFHDIAGHGDDRARDHEQICPQPKRRIGGIRVVGVRRARDRIAISLPLSLLLGGNRVVTPGGRR